MASIAGDDVPVAGVAVILPAFNEVQTIEATIGGFHLCLPDSSIWIVDNGSSDGTGALAMAVLQRLGCAGGVLSEARPGKANAIRRAFTEIDADVYLMADADQTYPANRAADLIAPILAGHADMVVGDRHSAGHYALENKRPLHGAGNRLVQLLVNKLFRADLADIMSGYRAFNRRFVKGYPILVEGFELETDLTLHALDKRFRVLEIPIEYRDRPAGSVSKLSTYRDGAKVLFVIVQIFRYYRPLLFFGALAGAMLLFGLAASLPVFDDWFRYRYIYHLPLAILAAASVIVSVIMVAVGLMLDSIAHQQKMNYELTILGKR
jgi:glycosyltransferase involved in cell wall biosynthesis